MSAAQIRNGEVRKAIVLASADMRQRLDCHLENTATVTIPWYSKFMKEENLSEKGSLLVADSKWVPSESDVDSGNPQQRLQTLELARKYKKRLYASLDTEKIMTSKNAKPILTNGKTIQEKTANVTYPRIKKNDVVKKSQKYIYYKKIIDNIDCIINVLSKPGLDRDHEIEAQVCFMLIHIKDLIKSDGQNANNGKQKLSKNIESTVMAVIENASENKKTNEENKDDLENVMETNSGESTESNHIDTSIEETNAVPQENNDDDRHKEWISIGSGTTVVHHTKYNKINFNKLNTATRGLLSAVFPRSVLATHSMSGRRPPAFPDKPVKMSLDQRAVSDIIQEVLKKFPNSNEKTVRNLITSKCADECKMMRLRNRRAAQDANRNLSS